MVTIADLYNVWIVGDLYEKDGKSAEAKTAYLRLVSEYPDSRLKYDAQQKAQSL